MPSKLSIGGLTPLTSIDYPGELAAVIFCQGCPWRCQYCHNSHLIPSKKSSAVEWSSIIHFLKRRSGLLDAVVFSGGEPVLQKMLPEAVREVKALGYKIGLHTAGCYPQRLKKLLPMLDWVALGIKALPDDYPAITQVEKSGDKAWQSLKLVLQSGIDYEVRTTILPRYSEQQIEKIASLLLRRGVRKYALQQCRTEHSLDASIRKQVPLAVHSAFIRKLKVSFTKFSYRS